MSYHWLSSSLFRNLSPFSSSGEGIQWPFTISLSSFISFILYPFFLLSSFISFILYPFFLLLLLPVFILSFTITSKVCNDAHIYNKSDPKPTTKAQVKVKTQNHTSHKISRTSAGKTKSKRRMVKPGSSTSTHNKWGLVKTPSLFKCFFSHVIVVFFLSFFQAMASHLDQRIHMSEERGKKRKSKGREKKE